MSDQSRHSSNASSKPGPPEADLFDANFVRRQKALARTAPIHDLESSKAMREGDWSAYDLRALALAAIDRVMEHMGLEYGASHNRIVGELAPFVSAADGYVESERVATTVLAALLNDRNRRESFRAVYSELGTDGITRRVLAFRLLQEVEAPDGSVVLRATDEAINLFYSALDHEIEDAQAAAEAVLRSQMSRGLLDRAVATAREARFRSLQLGEKIERALRAARRDLRQVDWAGVVSPLLDAALVHLGERMTVELELQRSARGQLERAEPTQLTAATQLVDLIGDCRTRHVRLHKQVLEARETFMVEQERQVFSPQAATPLPELEAELLVPLLTAARRDALPVLDAFARAAAGPTVQRQVRLRGLVDLLLQPRRERHDGEAPWLAPELVECDAERGFFTPAEEAVVGSLLGELDTPRRLSVLLQAARRACELEGHHGGADSMAVAELLRLLALFAFSPDAGDRTANASGCRTSAEPGRFSDTEEFELDGSFPGLASLCSLDDATLLDDSDFGGADLLLTRGSETWQLADGEDRPQAAYASQTSSEAGEGR